MSLLSQYDPPQGSRWERASAVPWRGHNGVLCARQGQHKVPWPGTLGYCPGWGEQQQLWLVALSSPGCSLQHRPCARVLGPLHPVPASSTLP